MPKHKPVTLGEIDSTVLTALSSAMLARFSSDALSVTLADALDSGYDSINVDKIGKGSVSSVLTTITTDATSAEIDMRYHNGLSIFVKTSAASGGTVDISLNGCDVSGGDFGAINKQSATADSAFVALTIPQITTDAVSIYDFYNIGANYVKISVAVVSTITATIRATPFNV